LAIGFGNHKYAGRNILFFDMKSVFLLPKVNILEGKMHISAVHNISYHEHDEFLRIICVISPYVCRNNYVNQ